MLLKQKKHEYNVKIKKTNTEVRNSRVTKSSYAKLRHTSSY